MNFKVSNLLQMLLAARYEYLLINDSDICVPHDYLRLVMGPLEDPSIGMVTCLYRGIAAESIGSRLESLGISSDFAPGVLCAAQLENGIHFALGATLGFHRRILDTIGGLHTIADHLADDFELGHRTSKAGFRVELADCIVDHYLPRYSIAEFIQHQLRWARTVRSSRPGGYAGLLFTFVLPWSVLALIAARGASWGWFLVAGALILRCLVALSSNFLVLRDRQVLRHIWLLPVRDFIAVLIWMVSYTGRRIIWRGERFEISEGKLRPA
jgi:ceramide glucosyltransferase